MFSIQYYVNHYLNTCNYIVTQEFRETVRVPDSVARLDTVNRTSFRQAYSLTNLANRFASSPVTSQKSSNREAESAVSAKI